MELFNCSLKWGIYPERFKQAKICVIAKPGRRDKSCPRSYRMISLLPALGKCLERIIARRLSLLAISKEIICDNYACAVPGRSVTDLTLRLAHFIERHLQSRMDVSMLTFDVKGAFDAVQPNRMVQRLLDQGWPLHVCAWVSSCLQGRKAELHLDDDMDSMQPVGGSLPQGSPISPILFMLFMAPLYDDMYAEIRGYADDGNLIAVSDHVSQNSAKLEWGLQRINRWCVENGLSLGLGKTGLLHITRKRHKLNPP